jgi:hypothetical protein
MLKLFFSGLIVLSTIFSATANYAVAPIKQVYLARLQDGCGFQVAVFDSSKLNDFEKLCEKIQYLGYREICCPDTINKVFWMARVLIGNNARIHEACVLWSGPSADDKYMLTCQYPKYFFDYDNNKLVKKVFSNLKYNELKIMWRMLIKA